MSTKPMTKLWYGLALVSLLTALMAPAGISRAQARPQEASGSLTPVVRMSERNDTSLPLRDMPRSLLPSEPQPDREVATHPLPRTAIGSRGFGPDPAWHPDSLSGGMPGPIANFEGQSDDENQATIGFRVVPPDTNGDIGYDSSTGTYYYVQWVNLILSVWDVTDPGTPVRVLGPIAGSDIWNGFGGGCETHNDGDPVVLFDQLANRWMISQFALYVPGHYECVAVSQTADPTGAWHRYAFLVSNTDINDYPKPGVWPDAYYFSYNMFDDGSFAFTGAGVTAFERDAMLNGDPAQMVFFSTFGIDPNVGGLLPSDLDGSDLPPAGAPNYFMNFDDDAWGYSPDRLLVWEFHVDWDIPGNSTFTLTDSIEAADGLPPIDIVCVNDFRGQCIDQPSPGEILESLSDRVMHRLAYRNYGTHESLVVNHSVDVNGSDLSGIRWYEVRDPGGTPDLYQAGTYSPNGDHRWMGSIAMDHVGNMALGYSVSSTSTEPAVRYTGRLSGDPLGEMPQGEVELVAGGGVQTGSFSRWGDYSSMTVDPFDDCTFWYTQEYYSVTGSFDFNTRIGSFKFPSCSIGPTGTLDGTVTDATDSSPIADATVEAELSPGVSFGTGTESDGTYAMIIPTGTYTVTASAYGYFPASVSGVEVISGTTTTQDFALTPAPATTVSGVVTDGSGHGWPLYARIDLSTTGFSDTVFTDPATGAYSVELLEGTTYTFEVSAVSSGYNTESRDVTVPPDSNTQDFALTIDGEACNAPGYELDLPYSEDFEADNGGFSVGGAFTSWEWGVPTSGPGDAHSGVNVWATNLEGNYSDNELGRITSPDIDLSAFSGQAPTLRWWQYLSSEFSYDFAQVQVSNDGGGSWTTVYGPISGAIDLDWALHTADLDSSYSVANFRVRFNFLTDVSITFPGWYVDDLGISYGAVSCAAVPGGLVVGNVYEANEGAGLNGATVTSDAAPDDSATTFATPDDPAVDDGFYILFSSLTGDQSFTASAPDYGSDTQIVSVVADDVVAQDFSLPAGFIEASPTSVEVSVDMGATDSATLTLTNTGGADATFELKEIDGGSIPAQPGQGALLQERHGYFTPGWLGAQPEPKGGEDLRPLPKQQAPPWTDIANLPVATMDNAGAEWDGLIYSAAGLDPGLAFLNTLYVYDPGTDTWTQLASMNDPREKPSAAFIDGLLYVVGGWDPSGFLETSLEIYDPGSDTWTTGASIPTGTSSSPAVVVDGLLYIIGGCIDGACNTTSTVQRYDPGSDTWETVASYPISIAWNACGAVDGLIYCTGGYNGSTFSEEDRTYVYDPDADTWTQLADLLQTQWAMGFTAANGLFYISGGVTDNFATVTNEGFSYDPGSDTWVQIENSNNTLYRGAGACGFYRMGGSSGGFTPVPDSEVYPGLTDCGAVSDVTWLTEDPVEGSLPADGGSLDITLNFDASIPEVPQPGDYLATLKVNNDTPYEPLQIPVTMTVIAPASWGKVTGTVTGLGYCDEPGAPLEEAEVLIESNNTLYSALVETDANGTYTHWLDSANSSLTVSASFPGYLDQSVGGVVITPGGTTTVDLGLRLPSPCASAPSLLSSLQLPDEQAVVGLTITNDGAADLEWSLGEGPTVPEPQAPSGPPERALPSAPIVPDVKSQVAPLADVIQDGSFEAGTPNPYWDEYSFVFGTPLCDAGSCGTGGGTAGPHSGSWWAWFGGFDGFEEGSLSQDVVIGSGTATLTFWLWIGASAGTGNDFLDVSLDGDVLFSVTDTTPGYETYTQVTLDVSAYADGGTHTLEFHSIVLGGGVTNMSVDDVVLDVVEEGPPPSECGVDIPWLSVSERRGTTAPDSSSVVDLTFDSTGLDQGFYTGILCLSSNDPVNPEIEIPITLVVYFEDAPPGYWAFDHIIALADSGVTAGCAANLYCPEAFTTRGQMAVFLLKGVEGADYLPPDAVGLFDDVPVDHPFADWIEELYNRGITAGCSLDPLLYCPDDPVTRAQMAVFLLKAVEGAGYLPPEAPDTFEDVPDGYWAEDWIVELYNRGITAGCSADPLLYCPEDDITRAQMAVFLVITFELPLPPY